MRRKSKRKSRKKSRRRTKRSRSKRRSTRRRSRVYRTRRLRSKKRSYRMVKNIRRRSKRKRKRKNLILKIKCDKKDDPIIERVYKFLRGNKAFPQKKIVNVENFKKKFKKYKIDGTEIFIVARTIAKEKNYTYFKNAGWSEDTEVCKRYLGLIKNITNQNTITHSLINTLNKAPKNSWIILVVQHQNGINIGGAQSHLEHARRLARQRQQARQQAAVQRIRNRADARQLDFSEIA